MTKLLATLLTLLTLSCSALGDATTAEVPVPIGCAHGVEIIADALEVIATTSGEDELRAGLIDVAKRHDRESIACAVDLFVLQRGGKLSGPEARAVKLARGWLESQP